ncbi:hypothetical protein NDU88_005475 [Pleurodeles waltl]|uniref:Uncharacterized protein n=1 Tax=Pleurodeles waltl TaxID=8319 RepID=A0AAV7L2R1_PLEWA|nr:hypothetical protein NDU88_005475 [Pleurodeles waltl]
MDSEWLLLVGSAVMCPDGQCMRGLGGERGYVTRWTVRGLSWWGARLCALMDSARRVLVGSVVMCPDGQCMMGLGGERGYVP